MGASRVGDKARAVDGVTVVTVGRTEGDTEGVELGIVEGAGVLVTVAKFHLGPM
jgi:hypothetical protein